MTHWTRRTVLLFLFILSIFARSECTAAEVVGSNNSITLPNISLAYQVKETGAGGSFGLTRDAFNKVDANSDIIVSFRLLPTEETAAASPAWQQIQELMQQVTIRAKKRTELNRQAGIINLNNSSELERLHAESKSFNDELTKQLLTWYAVFNSMGLSKVETTRIFTGQFDQRGKVNEPYANLTLWLRNRIEELGRDADKIIKSRDRYRVVVEAYLDPLAGSRKSLHVEGYDNLPIGELRPIDRMGLKMTPAEQKRFNMELQQNKIIAGAITELMANSDDLKKSTLKLLDRLQLQMVALEKGLRADPDWNTNLINLKQKLQELAKSEKDSASKKALIDLAVKIDSFLKYQTFLDQRVNDLKQLRQQLEYLIAGDLTALMQLNTLLSNFEQFLATEAQIATLVKELLAIHDDMQKLTPVVKKETEQFVTEQFRQFETSLAQDLPNTVLAIKLVLNIVKDNKSGIEAQDNLADTNTHLVARTLDDLPDARVELARSGLTQGDNVTVRVRIKELPSETAQTGDVGKIIHEASYKSTAVLMEWHRVISADLIFARGLSGDSTATKWKPNVAASANWHYTYRDPKGWWDRAVNGVNPGIGIHLASLSQGNESVEFGVGMNLSFFGGLLKGGGGFNLSINEKPYVYIAIDLLNLLNQSKGMAK